MLRTLCSTFPFVVCICWFVTFALHFKRNDSAKRVLTVFLGTCVVLYLCHAFYFNGMLPMCAESLWALCSLSVYPLYFIYITHLTCRPLSNVKTIYCVLPGIMVALAMLLFPGDEADTARKVLNTVQIFAVMHFGYRRLQAFDKEIADVYADTEGRDTSAVKHLLVAFVATSLLSAVANAIGKQNVAASEWLVVILVPFGILLYALSFIGYTRDFSLEQFAKDTVEPDVSVDEAAVAEPDNSELSQAIARLMEEKYYLKKNLKITDLSREVGSCRTYVSNYINGTYNCSFSDYINKLRVDYAKQLLQSNRDMKISIVSEAAGFSSEQSFYRNFKKFTNMTPAEWLKKNDC